MQNYRRWKQIRGTPRAEPQDASYETKVLLKCSQVRPLGSRYRERKVAGATAALPEVRSEVSLLRLPPFPLREPWEQELESLNDVISCSISLLRCIMFYSSCESKYRVCSINLAERRGRIKTSGSHLRVLVAALVQNKHLPGLRVQLFCQVRAPSS